MSVKRSVRDTWVCVMGGAGFLGSHLVNHLIEERNCEVLVLDNLISGQKKHVHPKAHFLHYDIMDDEKMTSFLLKEWKIEYVLNYAAEPYIPECFERPMHFFEVNATAVLKVLNACQAAGIKGLLQVSSAEIYGDMKGKIKETDPITPHSTYGVSKLAADGLVQVRWREAKVPAIALRQFNSYGPNATHEYVIPEIISQLTNSHLVKLGNNSFRDFLYCKDAVRMAVELLEKGQFGEVYNLGSEGGIQIYDLANKIGRVMGYTYVTIQQDPSRIRPWEIWHLQSDNSKIYEVVKYRPKTSFEEGLKATVDYFRSNNNRWDW